MYFTIEVDRFKNLHVFYSFKVQHIPNFAIIEEDNVPFLQEYTIITSQKNFLSIFKYSSIRLVIQVACEN